MEKVREPLTSCEDADTFWFERGYRVCIHKKSNIGCEVIIAMDGIFYAGVTAVHHQPKWHWARYRNLLDAAVELRRRECEE